jgi:hypothetical protein
MRSNYVNVKEKKCILVYKYVITSVFSTIYSYLAEILPSSAPVLPSSAKLCQAWQDWLPGPRLWLAILQSPEDSCRTLASPAGIGGGLRSTGGD